MATSSVRLASGLCSKVGRKMTIIHFTFLLVKTIVELKLNSKICIVILEMIRKSLFFRDKLSQVIRNLIKCCVILRETNCLIYFDCWLEKLQLCLFVQKEPFSKYGNYAL